MLSTVTPDPVPVFGDGTTHAALEETDQLQPISVVIVTWTSLLVADTLLGIADME